MIKVLSAARMQACDRAAIEEYSIPGVVLMENAGVHVVDAIREYFDGAPPSAAILCGTGNNGGDGLVVARHLNNLGCDVAVFLLGAAARLSEDAATNLRIAEAMEMAIVEVDDEEAWAAIEADLPGYDCIVDAMLGTGLRDGARGLMAAAIESVNRSGVPVVAVDLPSGLLADSGVPPGAHVIADLTVTFAALKPCHLLWPASEACGELELVDIGIPESVLAASPATLRLLTPEDADAVMAPRSPAMHKGAAGSILVIGGAPGTAGAVVLAARAALRGGAGLVHVATPASVWPVVAGQLTEALVHALPDDGAGGIGSDALAFIEQLASSVEGVALGPGLGTTASARALARELAARLPVPMVLDADGLNALGGDLELLRDAPSARVLTPHPGEMARLLGCDVAIVQADRPAAVADAVQRSNAVVLLKGHHTLIGAPGEVTVVNPTGNPGMASGGMGDVLTGLVAALLGQGLDPFTAAWFGACTHGSAGDFVAATRGEVGLLASDVVDALPQALSTAEELATSDEEAP